jgi:hypothetical protein
MQSACEPCVIFAVPRHPVTDFARCGGRTQPSPGDISSCWACGASMQTRLEARPDTTKDTPNLTRPTQNSPLRSSPHAENAKFLFVQRVHRTPVGLPFSRGAGCFFCASCWACAPPRPQPSKAFILPLHTPPTSHRRWAARTRVLVHIARPANNPNY